MNLVTQKKLMDTPSLYWKKYLFGIWVLTCREWQLEGYRHPYIASVHPDSGAVCIFRGPTNIDNQGHITDTAPDPNASLLTEKFRDAKRRLVAAGVLSEEQAAKISIPDPLVY